MYDSITLNDTQTCKRHKDSGNRGHSLCMAFRSESASGWPSGHSRPDTQALRLSLDPPRRRAGVRQGVRWVDNPYDDTPGSQREGAAPRASRLLFE